MNELINMVALCAAFTDPSFFMSKSKASRTCDLMPVVISEAKKNNIPITTFMIASDPYLQTFVKKFSEVNNGKAFYTGLDGLSEMVFEDYDKNRRQKLR